MGFLFLRLWETAGLSLELSTVTPESVFKLLLSVRKFLSVRAGFSVRDELSVRAGVSVRDVEGNGFNVE